MRPFVTGLALFLLAAVTSAGEIRLEVKYRTASTVYLSGGSADGLAVGDRLTVRARGETVGEVEVVYLAEHSASCKVVRETRALQVGDVAVITKASVPETTTVDAAKAPVVVAAPAPARTPTRPTLAHGGVALGWYKLWDDTSTGFDFEQRGARLDLSVSDIGGRPLQFTARARARQDLRTRPPGSSFENISTSERRDRLYEVALSYDPPTGRFALQAGRLGAAFLGIGYIDGGLLELRPYQSFRLGGFFGRRADVEKVPAFASGNKYGGFLRLAAARSGWPGSYDVTVSGVREMASSDVSREYLAWQGRFATRSLSFFQWAEVDLFRGWRQDAAGKNAQLSNLSLAANYRLGTGTSVGASYDLRRNYRTAETRTIAETLFDAYLNQGFRGSVDVARTGGLGISAFGGIRLREASNDNTYSFGGGLRHSNLFGHNLDGSLDGAGFSNPTTSGYQAGARLGLLGKLQIANLGWGLTSYSLKGTSGRHTNQWLRLDFRRELPHGCWVQGGLQYDHGDDVKGPRASVELGYRF